ncbi:endonuclease/exonuclease/phosphatase family protein [Fodinibius salsisoli]|uniref:Endonuclease/exonuclease/phosphatase family protein n=1 Tax=Fodinibius salsisoli TaxID=2820877 RepID=A0ABT3PPP4_9BACT|nr:endonuclease/exonuclease/phosphatase family protein [Fodinibius salsisoli]MCW9707825.1 endonuclease/exonuclease/phosphatase family protein [Fodinibius salsisoli]
MMTPKVSLLMVLGILWSLSATAQDTLTVMSYNIYHGEQAYEEGKGNLDDVSALIREVDPDFVALQEVDEMTGRLAALNNGKAFSLVDSLAKLTDMTGYFGKAINYEGGSYGEGLLSKKPLKSQKVMLPIPKGGEKRAALYVEGETSSGQPFIFAGTHLCHQYEENRLAQAGAVNSHFEDEKNVLIAGDFNFTPDSDSYRAIQKQWLDAAVIYNQPPEMTYSFEHPERRIDYLFLSKKSNWEVLDVKAIKRDYSDHLPLVARVVIHPTD